MLNIIKELEAARNYQEYGWTTVDVSSNQRRNHTARMLAYEQALNHLLSFITEEPLTIKEIAQKANVNEGTAKHHIAALRKRVNNGIERIKMQNPQSRGTKDTFFYFKK